MPGSEGDCEKMVLQQKYAPQRNLAAAKNMAYSAMNNFRRKPVEKGKNKEQLHSLFQFPCPQGR
jgi:hypothetical protein